MVGFNDAFNTIRLYKRQGYGTQLVLNACFNQFEEKDKLNFFINYRGKLTEKLAVSFKKLNAPCRHIMTMEKTKFILP